MHTCRPYACFLFYYVYMCVCPQLQGFLTEVLIDQLPVLGELQRFLSQLALTDPAPPKKDLILEQVQGCLPALLLNL